MASPAKLAWLFALAALCSGGEAFALNGGPSPGAVASTTLTLPGKPASPKGLADDASVNVFSGQVSYSIPIDVPAGRAGFGPSLSLSYSGELGEGPLGIGWRLGEIAIKRSLRHGVPSYTDKDEFELVGIGGGGRLVADTCTPGRFWVEGHGQSIKVDRRGAWWEVQDDKGTRYLLGFSSSSQHGEGSRVFAWHAEMIQDVTRLQKIAFGYRRDGGAMYLSTIDWGFEGDNARFGLQLNYEPRPDARVSWSTGFEIRTRDRATKIRVLSRDATSNTRQELRAYTIAYAPGLYLSRIQTVKMTGRLGQGTLPTLTFGYVPAAQSEKKLAEGTEGWRLNERGVSVFDVDGDGMADLYRAELGNHTWRKNLGGRFDAPRDLPGAGHTDLESVRFMDLDGDARPELVTIVDDTWRTYKLLGQGNEFRWEAQGLWPGTVSVPIIDPNWVFCDLNGDGRTDVLQAGAGRVSIRLNSDTGLLPPLSRAQLVANAAEVEPGNPNVRLQDFNGDGLADVIYFTDEWAKVWLGRGDGTFVAHTTVDYPWGRGAFPVTDVLLEDLDRDGYLDLIRTTAGHVTWFPGRPGGTWNTSESRLVARPTRDSEDAVVTTGDLDGDGASDVIWSAGSGLWIMDFASTGHAGMLESIENGLGKHSKILYVSSGILSVTAEAAGKPWERKLPASIPVPVRTETHLVGEPVRVSLNNIADGFWDGEERRFGGFLRAFQNVPDATPALARETETRFHPGLGRQRVLRGQAWFSRVRDGGGIVYTESTSELEALPFGECSQDPLLSYGVTLSQSSKNFEGVSTPIEVKTTFQHDAVGRVIEEVHSGRQDMSGDEKTIRRSYLDGEAPWVRNLTCEEVLSDGSGNDVSRARSFYADASGTLVTTYGGQITPGQATACSGAGVGWTKKTEAYLAEESRFIEQSSRDFDRFGNATRITDAGVTREIDYGTSALHPKSEKVKPAAGRTLLWTMEWDEVAGVPEELRDPNDRVTYVTYDSLIRVKGVGLKGKPTHVRYVYDWQPRVGGSTEETGPRTTTYAWDDETEAPDKLTEPKWRTTVSVVNGAGEDLYSATKLGAEGKAWIISGWKERDQRGRVSTIADAFYSAVLPLTRDPSAPLQSVSYDALDRPLVQTLPNGGKKSMLYKAFETQITASQQAPVTTFLDGLGRVMHTTRTVNGDAEEVVAQYDAADRILKMTLQGGLAVHEFEYDSLGRLVRAKDNDIGVRTMSYNDHNWLLRHTNGAQQTVGFDYDGAGRLTRRFEVATPEQSALRPPVEYRFFYDARPDASEGIADVTNLGACRTGAGDLKGRLSWVYEPQGLSCFGYDELGRQNLRQRVIYKGKGDRNGEHVESVVRSRFSFSGTLVEESYDDEFTAVPSYDDAGRLISVTSPGLTKPYWQATSLDASGRVLNETYGNNVEQAYQRDELGMPHDIQVQRPRSTSGGLETIFHTTIERNLYGAPTVIKDLDGHGLDHSATYGYDPAARLTAATVGSASAQYTFRYAYDGLQNMIKRAASGPRADLGVMVGHYQHDAPAHPRRLKQVDSPLSSLCGPQEAVASFAYDEAGRMIKQSARTLEFDGFDQLLKVAEPQVPAVEYAYGFDGFRTWRAGPGVQEYWFAPGDILRGDVPEHVITVGDRLVARVRAGVNGAPVTGNFVWVTPNRIGRLPMAELYALLLMAAFGLGLAVLAAVESRKRRRWAPAGAATMVLVLLGAMGLGGCGQAINRTGQAWGVPDVTFVHHGVAAGPVLFTKGDASVFDERRYEPFGGDIDSYREGGSDVTGIEFTRDPQNVLNKETDSSTGWSYHGARWMAPEFARWVSPDPPVKAPNAGFMKEPWGLNPYQYVDQNPTVYWDPDGQQPALVPMVEGPPQLEPVARPISAPHNDNNRLPRALPVVGPFLVAAAIFVAIVLTPSNIFRDVENVRAIDEPMYASAVRPDGPSSSRNTPPEFLRSGESAAKASQRKMEVPYAGTNPAPVRNARGGVDFSGTSSLYPVREGQSNTVRIEYTGSRRKDFGIANRAGNIGTTQKPPKDYSWHHVNDYDPVTNTGTLQLVKTIDHQATYPHSGGVAQYEKATGKIYK